MSDDENEVTGKMAKAKKKGREKGGCKMKRTWWAYIFNLTQTSMNKMYISR